MKNIIKLFKEIDKIYPHFSLRIMLLNIILGLIPLLYIIAPKLIIEELMGNKRLSYILFIGGLVLVSDFFKQIISRILTNTVSLIFEGTIDVLLFKLSEKSLRLPIEKSDSKNVQDMMEKAHYAIFEMYEFYDFLVIILSTTITGIFSLFVLLSLNPFVALIIVFLYFINKNIVEKIKANELKYQENNAPQIRAYRFFLNFSSDHRYFKDVETYEAQELVLKKAGKFQDGMVRTSTEYFNKNGIYTGIMNIFSNLSIVSTLIYMTYKLVSDAISLANFTLYFNSLVQMINAVNLILQKYAKIISLNSQLKTYFDFLDLEEGLLDKGDVKDIDLSQVKISFDDVSFKYPKSENYVLRHTSFEIDNGETVALVGKNGAGKSTIVKLLCKFYEPTDGAIYLNDINIKDIDTQTYYKILSPTFQDFRLFPFRISENINSKLLDNIDKNERAKMDKSFKLINIDKWIDKQVEGSDTYLTYLFSDKSVEPSGGIGQKLALSRSMVHEGKFFIMDEPTSALDPRSEEEIFKKMLQISKGQTSLFISHRLSSTKYADRIIVCDDKKIVESGSHKDLINNKGLYEKMFKTQADLYK
ncbi:ABC transporter ATP-binding protein [Anaerococcus porci]|uniref:ABC transporter ATP-binding protein n=1 Tax=Anaerococcus porci TaxID=2652269 RepID=A0A6N7VXC2_9FIRM|nr:ABC transporter ATP-binding protein [Anaerococcus porci]MDY3005389.1 ABC transporter ATP-binding protein [Anaerococcus porci]MSS78359.1 ABC transporter ATP-binding protein [Anaerococcus porci]